MFYSNQVVLSVIPFYLDPGSGSLLIQLLLAAVLGIGVAVRLSWGKIKALFSKKEALPYAEQEGKHTEE